MDLDRRKKIANRAYEPYFRESFYCLGTSVMVSFILIVATVIFSVAIDTSAVFLLVVALPSLVIMDCAFNYRLSILALIERRKCDWKKAELRIIKLSIESSWSGPKGESVIPKLYPKEQEVNRVKLICKDRSDRRVVLHTVMGIKNGD